MHRRSDGNGLTWPVAGRRVAHHGVQIKSLRIHPGDGALPVGQIRDMGWRVSGNGRLAVEVRRACTDLR